MLTVPNRVTWEGFFNSQLPLFNCNVKVYDENNVLLIDKKNIKSFTLTSRNNYVCDEIPADECSIQIVDWQDLSSTTKTKLSTFKQIVYIKYVVNGVETTGKKLLKIKSIDIDRKQTNAKIELSSYFNFMTASNWYDQLLPYGWAGYSMPMSPKLSLAETYQQMAMWYRKALFITQNGDVDYLELDTATPPSVNFSSNNIHDDYKYTYEDNKSTLRVFGYQEKTETQLTNRVAPSYDGTQQVALFPDDTQAYVITSARYYYNTTQQGSTWYCLPRGLLFTSPAYQSNSRVSLYGYVAELEQVPRDADYPYIQCLTLSPVRASYFQTYCRNYYAFNKIVTFDCRIDPTIEPLDMVQTDLDEAISNYIVEEVTVDFNGGFTGSVRGRIYQDITTITAPSVVFNINQANFNAGQNDSYSFAVTNSNAIAVDVIFSDGSDIVVKTIPANTTSTFYQTTDLNNTYDVAVKYREDNITCQFRRGSLESSSVVALAEVTTVTDPVISIDYQHGDFSFTNNNPMAVELVCWWSDYDYAFRTEIKGGQTLILSPDENSQFYNSDFARSIEVAYEDFMQGDLQDDYQCCLEGQLGDSNNVIIFDATPLAPQISNALNGYVTIQNPNPYSVTAYVVGSQIYGDITVGGNQSVTYGYDVDLNTDWNDWKYGNLQYDVYCYFRSSSHASDNTIIYEENAQ